MRQVSQLWILSTIALFALVAANIAWLFPTIGELDSGAYLLHRTIAADVRNQIGAFLDNYERSLREAADILNQQSTSREELVARLMKENPPFNSVGLLDLNGKEVLKNDRLFLVTSADLKDRSSEDVFHAVANGDNYRGPVIVSGTSEPIVTVAIPLQKDSGLVAIVADINLKFLLDVVRSVDVGQQGAAYVVDRSGYIIAHPNASLVFGRTNVLSSKLIQAALNGQEADTSGDNFAYKNSGGDAMLAVALPFPLTNWAIVVENTQAVALASSKRILGVAIVSFVLELLLLALLMWNYLNLIKSATLSYNERNQREAILSSLSDGVIVYDDKSRINLMNPKAEELLGVKQSQIDGLSINADLMVTRPELKGLVEVMYPALAPYASGTKDIPGSKLPAKIMEINTSAPELKLQVTITQVFDAQGNIIGFLKILHDLSREILLGKLKSEFVSIAAHQLRTPLSAIKWTIKLLLEGDAGALNKEQADFLNKGYEINERMIKLVNDLLNAARIEEGRFGYEFKDMDLESFLKETFNNYLSVAASRSINLKFEQAMEGLPHVYADRENLTLVLNNLFDNAVKYTPSGGIVVLKLDKRGNYAAVSVSDTGVGIPENEQKRVFSKFFRAANVLRMETEGTGLGLFIIRNIIRRHGGDVTFTSKENIGTTFVFTLPLYKELVPKEAPPPLEEFLETI